MVKRKLIPKGTKIYWENGEVQVLREDIVAVWVPCPDEPVKSERA